MEDESFKLSGKKTSLYSENCSYLVTMEGGETKIGLVNTTLILASTSSISVATPILYIFQIGPIIPFQITFVLTLQINDG